MTLPEPSLSIRPLLVLAAALVAMICAGTQYWFPALAPGLQHVLHLSDADATVIVAVANSGSWLGFVGGYFHQRYGSRIAATTGAAGITACYLLLARLAMRPFSLPNTNFIACIVITIALDTFSYTLYSACVCAAASVFNSAYRGRVVGLSAALYAAGAGVFSTVQSAFYPQLSDTYQLLLFVTIASAITSQIVCWIFPGRELYDTETATSSLPNSYTYAPISDNPEGRVEAASADNDNETTAGLRLAFAIAWVINILLQITAISDSLQVSRTFSIACALLVSAALLSYCAVPFVSKARVYSKASTGDDPAEELPPFSIVARDSRYLFLAYGAFSLIGGGGIAVLVQAPHVVASRTYAAIAHAAAPVAYNPDLVARIVRSFVILFSACNFTSRLVVGTVMDWGDTALAREMWKYDMLVGATFAITLGLLAVGFLGSWFLYAAVAVVGACHGTYFSSSPALVSLWFGVQSFPRNFAFLGPFVAVGSATLASTVPRFISSAFGSWVDMPVKGGDATETERVCVGVLCTAPIFSVLAGFVFIMFLWGLRLRYRVEEDARICSS